MPPRNNGSRTNLLEKAGRNLSKTFSLAQLELKRGRALTLAVWAGTIIGFVILVAVFTTLSKGPSPPPSSNLSNASDNFKLIKRDQGTTDPASIGSLPDAANDAHMIAATGQSGAMWLGSSLGELLGGQKLNKRELPTIEVQVSTVSVEEVRPTHAPGIVDIQAPSSPSSDDISSESEIDPDGSPSIADIETGPGAIMRAPISWPEPRDLEVAAVTSTRKTRTRTSRIPWLTPVVTGLPVSSDMRCGADRRTMCGAGLCCSTWGWCGVTEAHCGDKCQSGFGRCNSDQSSPQPNSTNIVSPIATDEPVPPPSPPTPAPNPSPPSKGPGVIAYFPNWGPDLLSYDLTGIDIINYAFVAPRSDGSLPAGDFSNGGLAFALNSVAKKKYPGLRTVFSVGGWTDSRWFSAIAGDPNKRTRFANDAARYMTENRFDGVDIDWEYPLGGGQDGNTQSPSDPKNFVLLLKAIRARIGSSALLTIAASADLSRYGDQITQIAQQLDVVNLMTYDFAGGWQGNANLNSPLDEQSKAMRAFANAGVPKEKLSMGLAFYGRGFTVSSAQNNGLGQRITGSPQIDGTSEPGVWGWSGLRRTILTNGPLSPSSGWTRTYLTNVHNPVLYNANRKMFIGYDDPVSICNKAKWAREEGYGGVMVWELSMDVGRELASAMIESWKGTRRC